MQRWPESKSERGTASALRWFLSKSSKYRHAHSGFERSLLHAFSNTITANEELPIGVLRTHTDDKPVLCADPVFLQLGVSDITLIHGPALELTKDDIDELGQYLNAFFEQQQLHWRLDQDGYGVLQLDDYPVLSTTPLSSVSGGIFTGKLPQGQDQRKWHRLGNEIQMLLHDSEFNQRRVDEGKLPINTLWFWGAGHKRPTFDSQYNAIFADDEFSKLLATHAGQPVMAVPESFTDPETRMANGHTLIVLDRLWPLSQKDDYLGWMRQLEEYDKQWFQPLRKNLPLQQFVSIRIRASSGELFTYKPYHRFRFWRRSGSLHQYFQA